MAISVARAIELIVDWTHEEIIALEAHLGIHPNRKPPVVLDHNFVDPPPEADGRVTIFDHASANTQSTIEPAPTLEAPNGQEILQA